MTFAPPEITVTHGTYSHLGSEVIHFYRPRCSRCGWEGETVRSEGLARVDAVDHITKGGCATTPAVEG